MPIDFEQRVQHWIVTRIGAENAHPAERAMRIFEEACELIQAHGIGRDRALAQLDHVYTRPAGEPAQEAAGVAICLYGWCAAAGRTLEAIAAAELERIEAKPIEQIRASLARKQDADLVVIPHQRSTDDDNADDDNPEIARRFFRDRGL